ncbi:LytR/AlgR family response regulator transcription factor [Ascidiimonas sp. W6]|uniref:LytR/AlgR family response regulator transcription factor n=1 Tax=Ascidiimonas meishanensis TaxID=3128903 RepID=UPI0030EF3C2D
MKAILVDVDSHEIKLLERKIKQSCPCIKLETLIIDIYTLEKTIDILTPKCIFIDSKIALKLGNEFMSKLYQNDTYIIVLMKKDDLSACVLKIPAFNFLLKSFDNKDLKRIYKHLRKLCNDQKESPKKIRIAINGSLFFFHSDEIILLKAEGNYTQIFLTNNRKFLLSKTLKEVIKDLPESYFYRIHHSYCINLKHVIEYKKGDGGMVILSNGECSSISRGRKEEFLKKMI